MRTGFRAAQGSRRLGYPTTVKDLADDPNAVRRFADSRNRVQAAIASLAPQHPWASQMIQADLACQLFVPASSASTNGSEFCAPKLDAQIQRALEADSNNSPDAGALWAEADRTATDQAPIVPLTTPSSIDLVSAGVGNYQYSLTAMLLDQLWVR